MKRFSMRPAAVFAAFALAAAAAAPAFGWEWEWNWRMPGDIYKGLEFESRNAVDRAYKATSAAMDAERAGARPTDLVPRFRAAAAEWRKVEIQAESDNTSDALLAYAGFMQGYTRMKAYDVNEAVKFYGQVVDLYDDERWIAFPARYFIGRTKIDMGDTRAGWPLIEELVDDEADAKHPLMGNVLKEVGWRWWDSGREAEAQELWERGAKPWFAESNRSAWDSCRYGLLLACTVRGDFGALDEFIFAGVKEDNAKRRADIVVDNRNWVLGQLNNGGSGVCSYYARKFPKEAERKAKLADFRRRYIKWYLEKRPLFVSAGREFEFDVSAIRLGYGVDSREETNAKILKLVAGLQQVKDPKQRDARVRTIVGLYYDLGDYSAALILADKISEPLAASWLRYEICRTASDRGKPMWKECLAHLDEYIKRKPDAGQLLNAKYIIVWICRERTGDLERALKTCLDISDPPRSLWELTWTYRKLGDKKKAENCLVEISSMFANDAPRAVLTLAQLCEQDGDKKKAIALYRRLLSQPEWKKTGESSQAHQALERLGERTGGAMVNEVH